MKNRRRYWMTQVLQLSLLDNEDDRTEPCDALAGSSHGLKRYEGDDEDIVGKTF